MASKSASKKKLADMDIDDFMAEDFGSDDSDNDDDQGSSDNDQGSSDESSSDMKVMQDEKTQMKKSEKGKLKEIQESDDDDDDFDEDDESDDEEDESDKKTSEKASKKTNGKLARTEDQEEDDSFEEDSDDDDDSFEEDDDDDDSFEEDSGSEEDEDTENTAIAKKTMSDKSRTKESVKADKLKPTQGVVSTKKTKMLKKDGKKNTVSDEAKPSSDMEDSAEKDSKTGKKLTAIDKHKQSIDSLKEKDPDFYQFLQENDQELLNFEDSDASDDDEEEEEDEEAEFDEDDSDEEGAVHELPAELEEASDKEDGSSEEEEDGSKRSKSKGIAVTIAMVDKWGDQLEDNSVQALRELVEAFKAAVYGMPDEEEEQDEIEMKYVVQGSNVFNAIISLCLKGVHPMLQNLLKMDANTTKRLSLPSSSKGWKNVHNDVREYLLQLIQLLAHMVDPAIVCVVLRHIHKLIPYYCCFPKMTRSLIKKLVPFWSTGEETVRVVAFLGLFTIPRYMKKPQWLELILKQMYMAYVKNTKFTSPSTLPLITFMQRSMTEMFAVNTQITYQHAFVYIRQLAIHLRNAITIKKDQYQSVYNWQYIHCVWLWCRVLGTLHSDQSLQPLVYPLVQTSIGVIKLIPAAKYIPLRFSIIRALNILSEATDTFIPLIPHILDIFDLVDFNKRPVGVSFRPLNFAVALKLSTKQLAEKGFKDGLMDEVYELLLEHLVVHSHSISFPELALPVILKLKAFIKGSRIPTYSKLMKGLLDKIQENCREITQKRDAVTFGLADDQSLRAWENKIKDKGTSLSKLYTTYKPLRERELKTEEAGKDRLLDLNFPTVEKREKQRKMKEADKEDFKELFEEDSDSEDDILVRAEKKGQRLQEDRKKGKKRKKQTDEDFDEDEDDSDLDISDDDEFDDESEDDDDGEDDSDGMDADDLGSDGDLKVNKGTTSQGTTSMRTKETKKQVDLDVMDDVEDVVEDFKLWSDDEDDGAKGEKKRKKGKGEKVKSKMSGKGKGKKKFGQGKFGKGKFGKGNVNSKKPKLEGKV
ncbi:nucleolar complex protein 2 homolog [Amphiura filiformis]|uniref:nucleolar complex protein 2 homolog n=1 Tax=Amphiura filiformis TaxID=82378 RepID=UPI003B21B101